MTERTRLEWAEMAHKFHVATDGTCYTSHHPLCPFCNPHILEGDPSWHEAPICAAATETSAPTAMAPARTRTAKSAGPAVAQDGKAEAADRTSWAFEPRQEWLARTLKRSPYLGPNLIAWGLWTGDYDIEGLPIPSERALRSGMTAYLADRANANLQGADSLAYAGLYDLGESLWAYLVFPVYDGPEPTLNKMRSLRDTLITNPECGPRLISAGLWTGEYDDAGMPIPTVPPPERRSR